QSNAIGTDAVPMVRSTSASNRVRYRTSGSWSVGAGSAGAGSVVAVPSGAGCGAGSSARARPASRDSQLGITREAVVPERRVAREVAVVGVGRPERVGHVVDARGVERREVAEPGALEQVLRERELVLGPHLRAVVRLARAREPERHAQPERADRA